MCALSTFGFIVGRCVFAIWAWARCSKYASMKRHCTRARHFGCLITEHEGLCLSSRIYQKDGVVPSPSGCQSVTLTTPNASHFVLSFYSVQTQSGVRYSRDIAKGLYCSVLRSNTTPYLLVRFHNKNMTHPLH